MDRAFATETLHEGEVRVLLVRGEVDMESAPRLLAEIGKALGGTSILKVRLSEVPYLDSSGLAVLIQGLKEAKEKRVDFRLDAPSEAVRSVLALASLDSFFVVEDSTS